MGVLTFPGAAGTITLAEVVGWLEQQPEDSRYSVGDGRRCVVAQYARARHEPDVFNVVTSDFYTQVRRQDGTVVVYQHDVSVRRFIKQFDRLDVMRATRDQALAVAHDVQHAPAQRLATTPPADAILAALQAIQQGAADLAAALGIPADLLQNEPPGTVSPTFGDPLIPVVLELPPRMLELRPKVIRWSHKSSLVNWNN